jgi:3-oxoacyl-[acyl-carrier protein] reductase
VAEDPGERSGESSHSHGHPDEKGPQMARVAMVTGGAGGIGAGIALRLAGDGIDIAVADRDEAVCAKTVGQIVALGRRAIAVSMNAVDADSVLSAFARANDTLGPPTVLLNNVGAVLDGPMSDMSGSGWDECVGNHLRAAFVLSRAALEPMIKMGWGRIVTVADGTAAGSQGSAENRTLRAGLEGFTKTLALELDPFDITANLILAGLSIGDRSPAGLERLSKPAAGEPPAGRGMDPAGLGHAVSFLVSNGAAIMSGQVVQVVGNPAD